MNSGHIFTNVKSKKSLWKHLLLNLFLFIRGLSCPSCVQASLSLNCFKLTIPGFPYNCLPVSCGDISFLKKILGLVLAWKSGLRLLQLVMAIWCCQQRAVTPDPESSNANKKGAKLSVLSAEGCHTQLEVQHCPLITYQGVFFKVRKTL
jgi:hypothetical protein